MKRLLLIALLSFIGFTAFADVYLVDNDWGWNGLDWSDDGFWAPGSGWMDADGYNIVDAGPGPDSDVVVGGDMF